MCRGFQTHTGSKYYCIEQQIDPLNTQSSICFLCSRYSAALFECPLIRKDPPEYITLMLQNERRSDPTYVIPVTSSEVVSTYSRRFTVCLMPLNNNYSNSFQLVEWIELNRLLGAERFTVYNYSSAENVKTVLEYYQDFALVEVLQWQIPLTVETWPNTNDPDIHYFGQLAALHDCLYRNKRDSEYVVNEDLDEFIIPYAENVTTWSEMVHHYPSNKGTYRFKNVYYRQEWRDDSLEDFPYKDTAIKYKLVTLLKTKHEPPDPFKQRTKYMSKTAMVNRLQVHSSAPAKNNGGIELVPPSVALLHHYRNWQIYGDGSETNSNVDRTVMHKYGKHLVLNAVKVLQLLENLRETRRRAHIKHH